jgi:hypothetical protein
MAFKLKLKRGTAAPANTALDVAEPGYDTSAKKLYIGNGSGVAASGVSMDGHAHSADDITSGTLSIDRIPTITTAKGGTNITTYTTGDILYGSNTNVLSKLGIGSTGQILTVVAGVPAWADAGVASSVANDFIIKFDTGSTEGTDLYTFDGSAAKTIDIKAGGGITLSKTTGAVTIAHTDTSSQATVTANGRTYITGVTLDTYGHVTALTTGTETVTDTNTTYDLTVPTGTTAIRLAGSDAVNDDITLTAGSNITITRTGAQELTIAAAHPTISAASSADNSGVTFIQDVTLDSNGHVTALGSVAVREASAAQSGLVSTGTQSFAGDKTFSNNVIVTGNLTVNGTTTTVNSNTISVGDNIIVLNGDETSTPSQDAGIEIERGTSTNVSLLWNETTDRWTFTNDGTTYYNIPLSTEYNNYTHPNHTGDVTSTGDGVTAIAAGVIVNADINDSAAIAITKLAASTISGISLGNNLNSVTFNSGGTGDASGTTYNGSTARTISYNTIGAAASGHTHSLDDLTDVTITSPAADSLLQYNGSAWIDIQELDCGTYAS